MADRYIPILPPFSDKDNISNFSEWVRQELTRISQSLEGTTARIWCTFDGTGTPSINNSSGIFSITDNGTGDYTVNFERALQDTDYTAVATSSSAMTEVNNKTASSIDVLTRNIAGIAEDADDINLIILEG